MATPRVRAAAYVVVFLALLLAGCEIRQDITISFNADSSGQISLGVLLDEEALVAAGGEIAINDLMTEFSAQRWSTKPDQESGFRGFTATASFEDQTEFTSLVDDLAGQEAPFSELSYAVVDDVATLRAAISTSAEFAGLIDFVVTTVVDMPGEIQTSSAGTVEGSRVTWVLSSSQRLSSTERLTVTSDIDQSPVSAFGGFWLLLTVGALALFGIVAYARWGPASQQRPGRADEPAADGYDPVKEFITTQETATHLPPETTPPGEHQSTGSLRIFCGSCGTLLQAADRFCASCGASTTPTSHHDTGHT